MNNLLNTQKLVRKKIDITNLKKPLKLGTFI